MTSSMQLINLVTAVLVNMLDLMCQRCCCLQVILVRLRAEVIGRNNILAQEVVAAIAPDSKPSMLYVYQENDLASQLPTDMLHGSEESCFVLQQTANSTVCTARQATFFIWLAVTLCLHLESC